MWRCSIFGFGLSVIGPGLTLALGGKLAAQEPLPTSGWNVTVGGVALLAPRYPGSDQYRVIPAPMAQMTFQDRVYLGPSPSGVGFGVGAYLARTSRADVAAELGVQDERPASRADALAGMNDRDVVATLGASVTYRVGPLQAALGAARGLNDGAGTLGTARLSFSRSLGVLAISIGVGATFADARQMRREFGVTTVEASRRQALVAAGDERLRPDEGRVYRPDGGLRHVGWSVSAVYVLSPRWSVIGFGGADRLSDEASASPLVRRRVQYSGGVGLGYRW